MIDLLAEREFGEVIAAVWWGGFALFCLWGIVRGVGDDD